MCSLLGSIYIVWTSCIQVIQYKLFQYKRREGSKEKKEPRNVTLLVVVVILSLLKWLNLSSLLLLFPCQKAWSRASFHHREEVARAQQLLLSLWQISLHQLSFVTLIEKVIELDATQFALSQLRESFSSPSVRLFSRAMENFPFKVCVL